MYKAEEKSAIEKLATLVVSIPKFYGVEILYSDISERIAKELLNITKLLVRESDNISETCTNIYLVELSLTLTKPILAIGKSVRISIATY